MFPGHVGVRQEIVDPQYVVTIGTTDERRGQPCVQVDVGEPVIFDERSYRRLARNLRTRRSFG